MSKNEIDEVLGNIPQPEYIALRLITAENRYEFPEDLVLEKNGFSYWMDHCIRDSQSRGFHVISVKLGKPTDCQAVRGTGILILKVAKLPNPRYHLP